MFLQKFKDFSRPGILFFQVQGLFPFSRTMGTMVYRTDRRTNNQTIMPHATSGGIRVLLIYFKHGSKAYMYFVYRLTTTANDLTQTIQNINQDFLVNHRAKHSQSLMRTLRFCASHNCFFNFKQTPTKLL